MVEIVIVDEFTGRQMPGRRWSEGLHQAVEAKEGLRVQRESVTLATITFQNYFRLYHKLAGMTGTALTEQEEFFKIYGLEVVAIPTHRPTVRDDHPDLVFRTENAKFEALIDEIGEMAEAGRPVLVGTVSVEKSEILADMLKRRGIRHEVLNAKFHEKEAPIVAQAGPQWRGHHRHEHGRSRHRHPARRQPRRPGLGRPAPARHQPRRGATEVYQEAVERAKTDTEADHERVVKAGGLHIIGTERHDARRIDNQLRGRAGRQGDPGSSRFYLSLEDTLMKRFASDRVAGLMERMGLEGDVAIESRLVSKTIENAQSRVEGYNFDIRKRVVEYDDVINKQRETIYTERDKVLHNEDLTDTVRAFLDEEIETLVDAHLGSVVDEWDIDGLARAVASMSLVGEGLDADGLADLGAREAILEHLQAAVDESLEQKEQEHGSDTWALVERFVLLRTIDSLWVEHLTELDDFRRGVGLRGYGGTDPLNEFKREAFKLYEELRGFIRHGVATTIFRVTVQRQAPPAPAPMPMPTPAQLAALRASGGRGAADGNGGGPVGTARPSPTGAAATTTSAGARAAAAAGRTATPMIGGITGAGRPGTVRLQHGDETVATETTAAGAAADAAKAPAHALKLGRNDACWCGSGMKFKKCHGK